MATTPPLDWYQKQTDKMPTFHEQSSYIRGQVKTSLRVVESSLFKSKYVVSTPPSSKTVKKHSPNSQNGKS